MKITKFTQVQEGVSQMIECMYTLQFRVLVDK
mgnify:CR=1 FL=1